MDDQDIAIKGFVEEMIDLGQFSYNPKVESLEHCRDRYQSLIKGHIAGYQERVLKGLKVIIDSHCVPDVMIKDVQAKLSAINLQDEEILNQISEGTQIFEIIELPIPFMDASYQLATKEMEKTNWEHSVYIFLFLATIAPFISQHWHGLGICAYSTGEFESALLNFSFAFDTSPDNQNQFISLIWIINTLLNLGKSEQAKQCKEIALKMIQEDHSLEALKKHLN